MQPAPREYKSWRSRLKASEMTRNFFLADSLRRGIPALSPPRAGLSARWATRQRCTSDDKSVVFLRPGRRFKLAIREVLPQALWHGGFPEIRVAH